MFQLYLNARLYTGENFDGTNNQDGHDVDLTCEFILMPNFYVTPHLSFETDKYSTTSGDNKDETTTYGLAAGMRAITFDVSLSYDRIDQDTTVSGSTTKTTEEGSFISADFAYFF